MSIDLPITFHGWCSIRNSEECLDRFQKLEILHWHHKTLQFSIACLYNPCSRSRILIKVCMSCVRYLEHWQQRKHDYVIEKGWHDWIYIRFLFLLFLYLEVWEILLKIQHFNFLRILSVAFSNKTIFYFLQMLLTEMKGKERRRWK
jgi:hypothetical protein